MDSVSDTDENFDHFVGLSSPTGSEEPSDTNHVTTRDGVAVDKTCEKVKESACVSTQVGGQFVSTLQ